MIRKKRMIWAAVLCCLLLVMAGCKNRSGLYVEQGTSKEADEKSAGDAAENDASGNQKGDSSSGSSTEGSSFGGAAEDGKAEKMIYVQVSGAVVTPGVYKLPEGSRVFEAVELAGGTTEDADVSALNQALVLSDGQMVYVYAVGEQRTGQETGSGQGAYGEPDDGRIDLNTATVEELMTLPGIGQSKAESIVSWREENGAFGSVEDILNITGIKEGVFSKIKDHIKVN